MKNKNRHRWFPDEKNEISFKGDSYTGKQFGLTDVELERMALSESRTFGDLVKASNSTLTEVFECFLGSHLIQARGNLIEKLADMD